MSSTTLREVWRDIPGYCGKYQVSNLGRVRSIHSSTGKVFVLRPHAQGKGYLSVALSRDSLAHMFKVHRLVAEAFVPNPDGKPQVNHKDGDKTNNRADNLEWATQSENIKHSVYELGNKPHNRILTDEQVRMIRTCEKSAHVLARELGVGKTTILNARRGLSYIDVV